MKILSIFVLGFAILVGAIILNFIAAKLGLLSWFEFLKDRSKADTFSYLWLFIIYPLALGLIAYFISKPLNL